MRFKQKTHTQFSLTVPRLFHRLFEREIETIRRLFKRSHHMIHSWLSVLSTASAPLAILFNLSLYLLSLTSLYLLSAHVV